MSLTYKKLSKYPHSLCRLVGIELVQLNEILTSLTPIWSKHLSKRYDRPGRHYKHDLVRMVSLLLIYYKSYITQEFVGDLFDLDDLDKSNVCRIIKKPAPLLAIILPIPYKRILTKESVSNLIIDVTERPIERPKQGKQAYYSGKKKQHTVKKEMRIDQDGTIIHVSQTYPGRVHDFAIFKQEPPPPNDVPILADAGY